MLFARRFQGPERARVVLALLAGVSGGCGQELRPNELGWRVGFVCEADRAETQTLHLRVRAGGCEQRGTPLYEAKLTRGEDPPEVGRIGSGSFGIEAVAYAEEQVIASTCVDVTLPRSEVIALKLRSPSCTSETSDPVVSLDAALEPGPEVDAAAAMNAQSTPDAGDAGGAIDAALVDAKSDACKAAEDCDDRNPCTTDSCASGSCGHTNNSAACDDGRSCTRGDVCASGECAGTSICPSGASCGGSTCSCNDSNKTLCGDSCVDLANDTSHCSACGRSCGSGASCQNGACKPGNTSTCTAHRHAGHDYLFCMDTLNWSAARDRCRSFGMVLVAIDDQPENDFLRDHLDGAPRWIGANDLGPTGSNCRLSGDEGSWYWTSSTSDHGTPFCTAAASGPVSCSPVGGRYQNWHLGEPNNGCTSCTSGCGGGQDCASIDPPGTWDDDYCSASFGYICETP